MPSQILGVGRIVFNTGRVGNIQVEREMCLAKSNLQCSDFLAFAVKFNSKTTLLVGFACRFLSDSLSDL